jgi:hypothetical protein
MVSLLIGLVAGIFGGFVDTIQRHLNAERKTGVDKPAVYQSSASILLQGEGDKEIWELIKI